ncbi:MAG: porin [Rubrivivax sp.]
MSIKRIPSRRFGSLAFSGLALIAASIANAQVTLYGIVDGGVAILDRGGPEKAVKAVTSGVGAASRWGIRVNEDLGRGLRAGALLESGFDLDVGTLKAFFGSPSTATPTAPNGTSSTGFNRRSIVFVDGAFGSIALGRDYAPIFYTVFETDVMRLGYFNNLQELVAPAGGQERFARISNSVFYTSPDIGGLRARAAYSFGSESSGGAGALPRGANHFAGVGVVYTTGNLVVAGSHQVLTYPLVAGSPAAFTGATAKRKDAALSAKLRVGDLTVGTGWFRSGAPQNFTDVWLGGAYEFGPSSLLVQVQRLRQDNSSGAEKQGTAYALTYVYALSKRSSLYASYGRTSNSSTGSFAVTGSDVVVMPSSPGASSQGLAMGIRHSF